MNKISILIILLIYLSGCNKIQKNQEITEVTSLRPAIIEPNSTATVSSGMIINTAEYSHSNSNLSFSNPVNNIQSHSTVSIEDKKLMVKIKYKKLKDFIKNIRHNKEDK